MEFKEKIDERLRDIRSLPAMPAIVNRMLKLAYDPDVDIKALAEEISRDPAITAGIIKLSNSAYFRPTGKVRSVHEAIVTLGLNEVKDIIVIVATRDLLKAPMEAYKMDDRGLLDHSLLVGEIASRMAAQKKAKTPPDVAFTAGILHDMGKVVLSQFFSKIHRQITIEMQKSPNVPFSELEKKYLGYNQNELGGKLLQIWNFPEELVEAVTLVYHPQQAKINPELTSIVHIANVIALSSGIGVDIGGLNEQLSDFALKRLGLTNDELKNFYQAVPEYCEVLRDLPVD